MTQQMTGQHPRAVAATDPDKAAVLLPSRGERRSYAELEANANRIAHLLHARGIGVGDHVALLVSNSAAWFDVVWAGLRSGVFITPVNVHLLPAEVAYILEDCGARALFASADLAATVAELGDAAARIPLRFAVDGELPGFEPLHAAIEGLPATPADGEREGTWMFYSSGTTGRPKGIAPSLPDPEIGANHPFVAMLAGLYGFGPDTVYLSPSPLYHASPAGWTTGAQRLGATVVAMERFDPREFLRLVQEHRVTHTQVVPTHLVRLLKLPESERRGFDLSSLRLLVHSAAPCPVEVKRAAFDWLGPVIHEFYAGSEGTGFFAIGPQEWLAHPGSVGRSLMGAVHILDELGNELPAGEEGLVWFESPHRFRYHGDPDKTSAAFNDRGWSTIGDIGRVDADGYLYLTDRASNMIISGGVNIYPREAEDVLVVHPAVADVAVIGTPHDEMGEQVTAVVQLAPGHAASPALAKKLVEHTRAHLSGFKCPREVRFVESLPRTPNGKLLKRLLVSDMS